MRVAFQSPSPRVIALFHKAMSACLIMTGIILLNEHIMARAATSVVHQNERLSARLISAENAVTPNTHSISAALEIKLEPGWKTYWKSPGQVGYPPELDWSASANLDTAQLHFPTPERFVAFGVENYGYRNAVTFPVQMQLHDKGKTLVARVSANILVCKEICVPETFDLALTLPAGTAQVDAQGAAMIAAAIETLPKTERAEGVRVAAAQITADDMLRLKISSATPIGTALEIFPDMGTGVTFGTQTVNTNADRKSAEAVIEITSAFGEPHPLAVTLRDGARAVTFEDIPVERGAVEPRGQKGHNTAVDATGHETDRTGSAQTGGDASPSLWVIVLSAVAGGLILNVMPCVFPVLVIKFASVLKSGNHSAARIRSGFVVSALGVMSFMWALAASLLILRALGGTIGWGIQFQNPVFLTVMIAVITLFAANMAGLFEITLPQAFNTRLAKGETHGGLIGDFATGALAAVLATPCSAPFLGTAVTFALAGSLFDSFVIFTALGLGLATPYLAVALWPGMVQILPKPGAWMSRVKWGMAVILMITALWLGTVLTQIAGAWSTVLVFFLLGLGLLALYHERPDRGVIIGCTLAAALLAPVALPELRARDAPPSTAAAAADVTAHPERLWKPFGAARIAKEVAAGRSVFVDVTAAWCLTCKVNKTRILDRGPVARALNSETVVALRADWTRHDPEILRYLQSHGRSGIPFNIVYGPAAPGGIALPEFLSEKAVLEALEAAR